MQRNWDALLCGFKQAGERRSRVKKPWPCVSLQG